MSKIAPCLWFKDEAEEAVNFYVSLLPNSRIDYIQRNVEDSPGGKDEQPRRMVHEPRTQG